jgi:hypothetical protein
VIKEFQEHGTQLTVICPLEVVSYTVELINLGCWELDFKRLEIADQGIDQQITVPTLIKPIAGSASQRFIAGNAPNQQRD